ncbi:MAG: ATP-dependent DNA helicase DinG [Planctomycetota bacterium]|jgi:ATP-dependent DNA helicase DinG
MIGPSRNAALPGGIPGTPAPPLASPAGARSPWEGPANLHSLAFATMWSTGPDPERDGVVRVAAWKRSADGSSWIEMVRLCDPFPERKDKAQSRRTVREFKLDAADLSGAPSSNDAYAELADFLEGCTVITLDRRPFLTWARELSGGEEPPFRTLDLSSLAALFLPGRLSAAGDGLVNQLLGLDPAATSKRALDPAHLHAALGALLGRVLGGGEERLAMVAIGYARVAASLARIDPQAASELGFALQLLEYPSQWRDTPEALFPLHEALSDGRLSDSIRAWDTIEDAVDVAVPGWTRRMADDIARGSLPEALEQEVTLDQADCTLVDQIFDEHVLHVVADRGGEPAYRPGQHQVARELATGFGSRELLLVHAPTGTGKTLAYLVPIMLWAQRNSVRVGVATFTRALQEQAMERDVPFARAVLERAGVKADQKSLRVVLLKGRQNYLCWRSLRLASPAEGAPALDDLAWLICALFAMEDIEGDLDRLPRAPPLPALDPEDWSQALGALVRTCRGEPRCCTSKVDRDTCGAEVSRRRAERAHVVVTNHAFALARREFFRLLVFDECEHLHDVAHNTFSRTVPTRALADLLKRFHRRGARRPPLNRIEKLAVAGTPAWTTARHCIVAREAAGAALIQLEGELSSFEHWRDERLESRKQDDAHSLFREYTAEPDATGMLASQKDLLEALDQLEAGCSRLAEHLDQMPSRGLGRARRYLDILRNELSDRRLAVNAWIPRTEAGDPHFRPDTFHDVELRPNGERILAARVLLPHEFLGRMYYPDLFGAVFISATTWLKDGFDSQATYLGLTRAAQPAEDEDRFECKVRTFRAPETFDYSRVLVGVPRDAPSVRDGKQAYLGYVARVIGYLSERTRGRILALFTNANDVAQTAELLRDLMTARRIPLFWQGQRGATKEELGALFRGHVDSVLLGLDTFWYGADFPGETLEHLIIARLPYGVPDGYHHAQCASLGRSEQRRQIYMPKALAKLRQGFGRLMRTESDRGSVLILDKRLADPRHRPFLRELPLRGAVEGPQDDILARLVRGDTDRILGEVLAHMELSSEVARAGLDQPFSSWGLPGTQGEKPWQPPVDVSADDVPF